MSKMKQNEVEWIGEIPEDWEEKKVKHSFVRKNEKAMQENPIVLSLARSGVKERDISNNEGQLAESYYNPVDVDDLLINPMDLYSGANCSISKVKGVISPAYINLRAKKNVSPVFYDYYFKVQYWMMAFFAHGNGVSFENRWTLNNETLQNYPIVAPSFEPQQCIASYLDKKCSKIEETIQNQQQVIEKLKTYKQSLITEAVTGKIKIQNGKVFGKYENYKDSGVEWIGKIPSGWEIPKIKYLHKGLTDGTHGTYNRLDKGYLLLSSKNVRDNYIEISDNESYISEGDFKEITSNGFPQKGDVLLCCIGASIGRCTIYELNEIVAFQRSVIMIRCNGMIIPRFLMYALKSSCVLEQENILINQSAQAGLYQGLVSKIYIPIASLDEQSSIASYLDKKCTAIDVAIEQKQKLIEKLTEYKKSLIYEYVTGKKEI